MPKKKNEESEKEQSQRFLDGVQELVDAGELNPTEADERFDSAVNSVLPKREKATNT